MQSTGNSNGGMKRRSIAGRIFRRNRRNKTEDASIVTEQEPSAIDRQHVKFVEGQQAPPQQQEYVETNMMRKSILQTGISPKATATPTQRVSMSEIVSSMPKSWITKTKFFRNMIDAVFTDIDGDGSGDIDEKELYSGLLLIHLKLGAYAGPAACKPISRDKCHAIFTKMDVDGSGTLDKEEFGQVMMVLFGNVMMRVLFQYACTLMIVPLVAKALLDGVISAINFGCIFVSNLDEHSQWADSVELAIEHAWSHAIAWWGVKVPAVVQEAGTVVYGWFHMIPAGVWSTVPLTLMSTILSLMLIPWSLMKIDDFFQIMAERKGKTAQGN